ncbi:hypothetical protein VTI28DRAFT_6582 [Corynascus sepedonium]
MTGTFESSSDTRVGLTNKFDSDIAPLSTKVDKVASSGTSASWSRKRTEKGKSTDNTNQRKFSAAKRPGTASPGLGTSAVTGIAVRVDLFPTTQALDKVAMCSIDVSFLIPSTFLHICEEKSFPNHSSPRQNRRMAGRSP